MDKKNQRQQKGVASTNQVHQQDVLDDLDIFEVEGGQATGLNNQHSQKIHPNSVKNINLAQQRLPNILPSLKTNGSNSGRRGKFTSWNVQTPVGLSQGGAGRNNKGVLSGHGRTTTIENETRELSKDEDSDENNYHQDQEDFMDEVDELLLEQDLLSPSSISQTMKKISSKNKLGSNQSNEKRGVSSDRFASPVISDNHVRKSNDKLRDSTLEKLLNGDQDLVDLDEASSAALSQRKIKKFDINDAKNLNGSNQQTLSSEKKKMKEKDRKKLELKKKLSDNWNLTGVSIVSKRNGNDIDINLDDALDDDEDFDLDNSDDLNRFINKYENMLIQKESEKMTSPTRKGEAKGKITKSNTMPSKEKDKDGGAKKENVDIIDDIDYLVEEELSRNYSEKSENDIPDQPTSLPPSTTGNGRSSALTVGETKSDKTNKQPKSGLSHLSNSKKPDTAGSSQSKTPKPLKLIDKKKSEVNTSSDNLNISTGSGNNESQMFKELFNTNKGKGIAGINNVPSSNESQSHSKNSLKDNDNSSVATKTLNKNTSKKNLKNKFQSSSNIYYDRNKRNSDEEDDDELFEEEDSSSMMNQQNQIKNLQDAHQQMSGLSRLHDLQALQKKMEEDKENKRMHEKAFNFPVSTVMEKMHKRHSGHNVLASQQSASGIQIPSNKEATQNGNGTSTVKIIEDEIDEIIKQHLMEEEYTSKGGKQPRQAVKKKKKKSMDDTTKPIKDLKEKKKSNKDLTVALGVDKQSDDDMSDQYSDEDDYQNQEEIEDEVEKAKLNRSPPLDNISDNSQDLIDDSLNLNVKSPKQTLIEHLKLLADIFNSSLDGASDYYDQIFEERAQFMLDFENILKIMTFDETIEHVLPCMQIYSGEQDYLKLKLFQNLEKLFKKLFKAEVFIPKTEIIDIITINIFPLASRMLMLSEEPVQIEGVEALLNLSKQYIPKDQAQNLMMKVIQVIMDRISSQGDFQESEEVKEKAKIAVLITVQKFAEDNIFEKEQCQSFLEKYMIDIQDGMLYKIKKFLLPALVSISKHLNYATFSSQVYSTFKTFNSDDIWGVRKVCVENLSNIVKHLKYQELEKLDECSDFFKRCLNDSNRWVKSQALIQFGPIIHQIYLKLEQIPKKVEGEKDIEDTMSPNKSEGSKIVFDENENYQEKLEELINKMCLMYYDTRMIYGGKEERDLDDSLLNKLDDYSFMQNKIDDVDKVKYYWAYNLPCAILCNGRSKFWFSHLKGIYDILYKDILINVRTAMSAGFKEIIELLDIDKMENSEDRDYFVTVLNHYLQDTEEISRKVLPTICTLVSKFPEKEKTEMLESLIRTKIDSIKSLKNGRDTLIIILEQLFNMFQPIQLMDANFHEYLFEIIKSDKAINYRVRAAKVLGGKIVANLIKGKRFRSLLTTFTDELRQSKNFRDRQIYINIAISTYKSDNEIFKKHFAKNICSDLENEKCKCVQIVLAKLCNEVKEGYSKSLDKVRAKIIADGDPTVVQYMSNNSEKEKEIEKNRRYLPLNYGDEKGVEEDIEKKMTEREWLEKEKKEIEEVEKTVNIRFANYTTLMRAQTLTQGLSQQLAMFLETMTGPGGNASSAAGVSDIMQRVSPKFNEDGKMEGKGSTGEKWQLSKGKYEEEEVEEKTDESRSKPLDRGAPDGLKEASSIQIDSEIDKNDTNPDKY